MPRAKIVVADDSPTELKVVSAFLVKSGFEVVTATDGEEAIAKIAEHAPKLVVLDVVMPKKNGYQVCREVKTKGGASAPRVILLTSKGEETDKFWGMKQGADAYLTKPFVEADLLSEINKLV